MNEIEKLLKETHRKINEHLNHDRIIPEQEYFKLSSKEIKRLIKLVENEQKELCFGHPDDPLYVSESIDWEEL